MANAPYALQMRNTSAPLNATYNGSLLLFGIRSLQKLYLACSLYRHCAPGHKLFMDICAIIDSGNLVRSDKSSVKLVEEQLEAMLSKSVYNEYKKLDTDQKKAIYDIVSCSDLELKNAIRYINELLPVEMGKEEYNSFTLGHGYNGESRYRYVLEEPTKFYDKLDWYFAFVIHISIVCDFVQIPNVEDLEQFLTITIDSYLTKYNFDILNPPKTSKEKIHEHCLNYLYVVFGYRISRLPVYIQKGTEDNPVLVYVTNQQQHLDQKMKDSSMKGQLINKNKTSHIGDDLSTSFVNRSHSSSIHDSSEANSGSLDASVKNNVKYYYYRMDNGIQTLPSIPFSTEEDDEKNKRSLTENFTLSPEMKYDKYTFRYHNGEWNYFDVNDAKYMDNNECEFCYHNNHWCFSKAEDRWKRKYNGDIPLPTCPLPKRPRDEPMKLSSIEQIIVSCVFFRKIMNNAPNDNWDITSKDKDSFCYYTSENNYLDTSTNPLLKDYKTIVDSICPSGHDETKIDSIMAAKANGVYQQFYIMEIVFKKYSIGLKYIFDILEQMVTSMKDYYLLLQNVRRFITMK